MKIYFIKVDAMPFCPEVLSIAELSKGTLLRQINSCFTTGTVNSMLTGKLTSDLHPHGLGYTTWKTMLDGEGFVRFPWIKENILLDLLDLGYEFVSRNWGDILAQLGLPIFPQFRNATSPYDEHDGHCWKFLTATGQEWIESRDAEFQWIDEAQASTSENTFYNINYSHFHAAIARTTLAQHEKRCQKAGQNVLELLGHYDFSEPNSLFWIYSDHGPWEHPHLDLYPHPRHFYCWSIVKDNTENPLNFSKRVIQASDFKAYIQLKLNKSSYVISHPNDRIFYAEDGRQNRGSERMTTAMACRFGDWKGEFPLSMSYVTWNEIDRKFLQTDARFDEKGFLIHVEELSSVANCDLVDSLVKRFEWVVK